jgi:tetratricopeptide (TPR) repeat protein
MKIRMFVCAMLACNGAMVAVDALADESYKPIAAEVAKLTVKEAQGYITQGFARCPYEGPKWQVETMPDAMRMRWNGSQKKLLNYVRFKDLRAEVNFDKYFLDDAGEMNIRLVGKIWQNGKTYEYSLYKCEGMHRTWPQAMANSFERLKQEFDKFNDPAALEKFKEEAARYRALDPKPEPPEQVRRFRIQAESAVAGKRFDEAIEKYTSALEVAPWWPEGYFNRGLVLGETQQYDSAMNDMKRYLMLRPDAPDARQAQDFIYAWEAYPFEDK